MVCFGVCVCLCALTPSGVSFCPFGKQIAVTRGSGAHAAVHVLSLPQALDTKLTPLYQFPLPHTRSCAFIGLAEHTQSLLLTAQTQGAETDRHLMVSVWKQETFHDKPITLMQSVNIDFPLMDSYAVNAAQFCDMIIDPSSSMKFVLLTHRYVVRCI